jgi:hypothetical protein
MPRLQVSVWNIVGTVGQIYVFSCLKCNEHLARLWETQSFAVHLVDCIIK